MSLPLLVVAAEVRHLRTKDPAAAELSRRWTKGLAVLFAVGAVSGTVLSFELGLLWPHFMRLAGPAVGFLFALEGFAFFLEAIFLGIFLYGRGRVSDRARLAAGVGVAFTGNLSALFVVLVNAWMNHPVGARFVGGALVDLDPWQVLLSPSGWTQVGHMVLASAASISLLVAGIHAFELRRQPGHVLHRTALELALGCAVVPCLLLPLTGHHLAGFTARQQPAKLAAMEAHWETRRRAPLTLGGWPDEATQTTSWGLEVPGGLSVLATGSLDGEVRGWADFPPAERPPVRVPHLAFQLMVGCGTVMALFALMAAARVWRGGAGLEAPWFLRLVVAVAPLGVVATEAGWVVTEVGRQPWVIQGMLRTSDAVTGLAGGPLALRVAAFLGAYAVLGFTVLGFLGRYVADLRERREGA